MSDIIRVMTNDTVPKDWLEERAGPGYVAEGDGLPEGFIELWVADSAEKRLRESSFSWTVFLDIWTLRNVYLFKPEYRETAMLVKLTWGGV